ncbi:MAG: hypothetical protein QGH85_00200 [Candidatus Pacebacteria bacterium]|jgi:hypothetical protein|nr:hypothetical protein [Candidatus Paceibacterota bacterium]MDP7368828.1 hypothetical protein [Candidatus Paceibacterota bacterium]MDP7466044.1 hypothetical protein [Candidatus Paceibacterota bacterium]MDP7648260.1 hypothetical protein [Candidatus Paceibacterota bacterium]|tara:strand:- start:19949 stop:20542 length:594 start_codon:yes stop_codon:yes gene_type:complete
MRKIEISEEIDLFLSSDNFIEAKNFGKGIDEFKEFENVDVYIEPTEQVKEDCDIFLSVIFNKKVGGEKYLNFINLFHKTRDFNKKIAVLDAHGSHCNGKWYFSDGKRNNLIQNWVRDKDGVYAAIILKVCNPGQLIAKTKSSLLMMADTSFSLLGIEYGMQICDWTPESGFNCIIHPSHGEISLYTIDYHITNNVII